MDVQTPQATTTKVPNPIYRKLRKAEAKTVIDAIHEVAQVATDQDQKVSQDPNHSWTAHDDRKGDQVQANYESGVNWRAYSVADAIHRELGEDYDKNRVQWYQYPDLRDTTSGNVSNINRVAQEIQEIADRL